MIFNVEYFFKIIPIVLQGLKISLLISISSFILSFTLGLLLSILMEYKIIRILNPLIKIYISFFRSTPAIALLFFIYFGLPILISPLRSMSATLAAIITLGLSVSAYMAEMFRSAINSIDKGQFEAALSIGMSKMQALYRIILPQALRLSIPNIGNNFIMTLKSTAVSFTIGVNEIMGRAKIEASMTYRYFEAYAVVILVYWAIVVVITKLQTYLEEKMKFKGKEELNDY